MRPCLRVAIGGACGLVLAGMAAITATGLIAWQEQQSAAKLPPPFATPSSTNRPKVVPKPEGAQLKLPQGFEIEEYASDFQVPRFMLIGPSGEILLSDAADGGSVYALVDKNKSFKKNSRNIFLTFSKGQRSNSPNSPPS